MARFVRLLRGIWVTGPYGQWEFRTNPTNLGFGAHLRDDENHKSLMGNIRRRYLLALTTPVALTYRTLEQIADVNVLGNPPSNILDDTHVGQFMALRFCYPDLTLCVTVGAEAVATYNFQCRSPFLVGKTLYLPENPNAYQNAMYHDLITWEIIMTTQSALEAIFTEEEMQMLHRVRLEMIYSNPLNQESGYVALPVLDEGQTEIIDLDDENENVINHTVANTDAPITTQSNGEIPISGSVGNVTNDVTHPMADNNNHFIDIAEVGVNLFEPYMQQNGNNPDGVVDDEMLFWEGLMSQDITQTSNMLILEQIQE